jgi:hypothetical protein
MTTCLRCILLDIPTGLLGVVDLESPINEYGRGSDGMLMINPLLGTYLTSKNIILFLEFSLKYIYNLVCKQSLVKSFRRQMLINNT